jgi:acetyltransferase-like isoleucine patch superfamily enzyme
MRWLWFYIKFFLKGGYINNFKKLRFSSGAWVGKNVSIFFEKPGSSLQSISFGRDVRIGHFSDLYVGRDNAVVIKDFTTLNTHCKIAGDVTIERYCLLSANILISSGAHYATKFPHLLIRHQDQRVLSTEAGIQSHSKPVHIEEDVWIGFGVYIKQGISIGRGAVVGANSVVLKDVLPYEIVGGNPARRLKHRLEFQPPNIIEARREEDRPYFYRGFDHYNVHDRNVSKEMGMLGYEECTVAIPLYHSQDINCKGFLTDSGPLKFKVSIDNIPIGDFEVNETCFELKICTRQSQPADRSINSYSFITFAVPYNKRLCFGINSIKIV